MMIPSLICMVTSLSFSQILTGSVKGEIGEILVGVNIVVVGTAIGTITDTNGNYQLENLSSDALLRFSYVGYLSQEITVGARSIIDVIMEIDVMTLEKIVVVGYGTQQKINLTGAVGTTTGEVLENRPIANVAEGLKGVIPNLNITIRNGDPASEDIDFNIRGYESINGGNPLILVDGVPMDLNKINPADIESISVLKDAAAGAVYGGRAAFGVILVQTKKGKSGRMRLTADAEFAMAKPILFIDPITDPYQYVLAMNTASQRTNAVDTYDQDYIDKTKIWSENPTHENAWGVPKGTGTLRFYGNSNYMNELITEFAPQQTYNFNISGATDKASYYVSFGYLNKDGYLKNSEKNEKFKRYNVLMKGDFKINEWLNADSRVLVSTEKSDKPHFYRGNMNINSVARQNTLNPISFPDLEYYVNPGDRADYEQYIGMNFGGNSFFGYLEDGGRDKWTRSDIVLTQGFALTPIKNLNIRGEFSYNAKYYNREDVHSKVTVIDVGLDEHGPNLLLDNFVSNGYSAEDWIRNWSNNDQYYVINAYADYTVDKGKDHYLKGMLGFNQEWGLFESVSAKNFNLITPNISDLNATVGAQETFGGVEHVALRGFFYRVNYIFRDRYLFEANGRYDATSRFPKDDRWAFFPSFSAGWRLSNESFMSGTSGWLNNLKLRVSYGELGNQLLYDNNNKPIYYPYIPSMEPGVSPYMLSAGSRTPYVSAAGLVSPTLTWETVISKNIGLDFTMFNHKLDVSFDIYARDTRDMLMSATYPDILGTEAPTSNAADLRTTGWELAVTWRNRINTNWNYGITLALSDNVSEITKYDNPTGALDEYYVGQIIGERWGFETVGIFQDSLQVAEAPDQSGVEDGNRWRPGDIQYADLNGDSTITYGEKTLDDPGDQKIIAYESPRYNFGITGNLGWKNFTLSLFFQGTLKYDFWPTNFNWQAFYPFNSTYAEWYYLTDSWSPENPDAYFPAPHNSKNTKQNIQPQTRFVQDASYIRLKNLTLAYELPAEIATKIGLERLQIYFSGENLWEYTTMRKPLDPEVRPTPVQEYYKQRIYSLGLKIII